MNKTKKGDKFYRLLISVTLGIASLWFSIEIVRTTLSLFDMVSLQVAIIPIYTAWNFIVRIFAILIPGLLFFTYLKRYLLTGIRNREWGIITEQKVGFPKFWLPLPLIFLGILYIFGYTFVYFALFALGLSAVYLIHYSQKDVT